MSTDDYPYYESDGYDSLIGLLTERQIATHRQIEAHARFGPVPSPSFSIERLRAESAVLHQAIGVLRRMRKAVYDREMAEQSALEEVSA